jgi:hypothetical protein
MAAGASSPEMFTSFIALFVDHSTLGVGTVVGSEIFNHMIICAGSVMYSSSGVLYLDKFIFTRDVSAYFLSLIILIWALKGNPIDAFRNMFASGVENECLHVTIYHATGLLFLYVCYAVVSGNFQAFLKKFNLVHVNESPDEFGGGGGGGDGLNQSLLTIREDEVGDHESRGGDEEDDGGILNVLTSAVEESNNAQNASRKQPTHTSTSYSYRSRRLTGGGQSLRAYDTSKLSASYRDRSQQRSTFVKDQAMFSWRSSSMRNQSHLLHGGEDDVEADLMMRRSKAGMIGPAAGGYHSCLRLIGSEANVDELGTMEISAKSLSGYLYLKSSFYNMTCCPVLKSWRLRYFTVDRHGLHSRKDRDSSRKGPQIEMIDLQTCHDVEIIDRSRGLFMIHRSGSSDERPYEFAATSLELLDEMVTRLTALIHEAQTRSTEQQLQFNRKAR